MAKMGLLLLAAMSLFGAQTRPGAAGQSSAPEPPAVSLCSLLGRPADYDGQEVTVRAIYNAGFESSYLADPSCKEYAVESTPYRTGLVVWAELGESVERATAPEVFEKWERASGFCCPEGWRTLRTEVLVTGRFFSAGTASEGYGHHGRYALQLVVGEVKEVGETTTAP